MKKRIIAALAASLALMALASTAGAAITVTQAPAGAGYQNLSPWNCGGRTYYLTPHQVTDQDGNPVFDQNGNPVLVPGSGLPIRLGFGWAAHVASQMRQFFTYSNGSISITGTDTFSDSWSDNPNGTPYVTAQGIAWSQLENIQATPPGGSTTVAAVASNYRGELSLAPGTYTLSVTFVFDRPVQDGFNSYKGSMNGTCSFTVAA